MLRSHICQINPKKLISEHQDTLPQAGESSERSRNKARARPGCGPVSDLSLWGPWWAGLWELEPGLAGAGTDGTGDETGSWALGVVAKGDSQSWKCCQGPDRHLLSSGTKPNLVQDPLCHSRPLSRRLLFINRRWKPFLKHMFFSLSMGTVGQRNGLSLNFELQFHYYKAVLMVTLALCSSLCDGRCKCPVMILILIFSGIIE